MYLEPCTDLPPRKPSEGRIRQMIVMKYCIYIYIYLYDCQSDLTSWFTSMTDSDILDCHQGNSIMLPSTLISYKLVSYKYTSIHVMDSL